MDAMKLYEAAMGEGVSVAPGRIFTLVDKYANCLRLNAAIWSERIEQGLETLGGLAKNLA